MVSEVSRLVTLVTEHRLAEKRKRIVVRCSVIEKISLSLLSARSNREPVYVLARGRVCTKRASPEAFSYIVLQTKGKKENRRGNGRASIGDHSWRHRFLDETIRRQPADRCIQFKEIRKNLIILLSRTTM